MGLLVRAACLLLAGWLRGVGCVGGTRNAGVGPVLRAAGCLCQGLCRALRPESRGRKAGRTFLQHSLGPRERPLLDYCSDS